MLRILYPWLLKIRKVLALNIFFLRKNSLPPMERFFAKIALDGVIS
ncbi:hypothetical protein KKF34_03595 [Myxococcota bacterium]|nr:hypothetical protein [Myxococcota bacterium]MBU1495941.1 hypothetical protein [Myxococcota bacterium]